MSRSVRYLLLRYDTVDFCERKHVSVKAKMLYYIILEMLHFLFNSLALFLPVRMFLKASSTLVESKAEVSINERVFFSEHEKTKQIKY